MNLGRARLQKSSGQLELPYEDAGEARGANGSGESLRARRGNERSGTDRLMEEVVEAANLKAALKRVRQNKGGPGIDGMTVGELPEHLKREWIRIREELLGGKYQPRPVKRQTIPKAGGGERELGIPTVLDRFIQQALLQVLQPRFDPGFSDHSYGFRPGRRAHDAVRCRFSAPWDPGFSRGFPPGVTRRREGVSLPRSGPPFHKERAPR